MSQDSKTRDRIKKQLSSLSSEELQALKAEMGSKALTPPALEGGSSNDASKGGRKSIKYKRDNKNRPREVSSKKTVGRKRKILSEALPEPKRDPRFDPACGEFNEKVFTDSYGFVDKIKEKEQQHLKHVLASSETTPEEAQKIKYLIQRHDNQIREKNRLEKRRKNIADGESILETYESLKKTGGLDKYMQKKEKKLLRKSKKRL
eukprot:TRINITY_DN3017_c0_g1_i1.p1 TRINITY_DN3017_c0_g1~~TRINITY_DN3017_c0_g1_i1.p1  ORF type:complete len:205 (-),score=81.48 TRINITY_DN3017_c0_g1_i1:6-620(-)